MRKGSLIIDTGAISERRGDEEDLMGGYGNKMTEMKQKPAWKKLRRT